MYNNQYLILYVPGKLNESLPPKKLTFTFLTLRATAHNPICHITIINFKIKVLIQMKHNFQLSSMNTIRASCGGNKLN